MLNGSDSVSSSSSSSDRRQRFISGLGFEPDRFQVEAFDAVDAGSNVVVAAPTGAGKTLVAGYAVNGAVAQGQRIFYTTPIKALSNQKFNDLVQAHGATNVGLLTGDNNINAEAPVVVMTTEVLRNMLYAGNTLERLATVVLDEVHYLQDAYRGPVWEEVIIHLPHRIQLVCLSATVSNADELAEWIRTVRGPTELVIETQRPVELTNIYAVGERSSGHLHVMKTLQGSRANPKGFRYDNDRGKGASRNRKTKDGRRRRRARWQTPNRTDLVAHLSRQEMLPAIYFIFSRAGCDDAARSVSKSGISFTSQSDRKRIRRILDEHLHSLSDDDLEMLKYDEFRLGLEVGVAAHHAGMVPPMKEAVEACFSQGLVKVVFATETLALGINMPARTVVIEKLTKFTGERHEFLTPAQFTQLTGRAGRRGIDSHGQAIVMWSPYVQFEQVATLATSRDFVLSSSFRPTYNMAANLVRRYEPIRARQLLNLSFAQFRADSDVVRSEHRIEKITNRRSKIIGQLERDFGPVHELQAASTTRKVDDPDEQEITFSLSQLHPGHIIDVEAELDGTKIPSPVVVLAVSFRKGGRIKVKVTDREGQTYEFTPADLTTVPVVAGELELPEPYLPNSVSFAYEIGQQLARKRLKAPKNRSSLGPSTAVRSKSDLPPGAVKGLKRLERLDKDLARIQDGAARKADSLAGQFDRVIGLLEDRDHLIDWELTTSGEQLARLYHESDLLMVEALTIGVFDDLSSAEVAAMASVFVYEERFSNEALDVWYPSSNLRRRFRQILALHRSLNADEEAASLMLTREPHAGFMAAAHGWASGGDLYDVLEGEEFTPGDFVRTAKQLIDVLRQLGRLATEPATASAARAAAEAVYRDLVAASSVAESSSSESSESESGQSESGDSSSSFATNETSLSSEDRRANGEDGVGNDSQTTRHSKPRLA